MVGYYTYKSTSSASTESTMEYYELIDGEWVVKTIKYTPSTCTYRYVSGSNTHFFVPILEVPLDEADTLYCLCRYSSCYYWPNFANGARISYSRPSEYSLEIDTIKYDVAPSQINIDSASQLLPGRIAHSNGETYIGDGSIYSNLNSGEVHTKLFNLTSDSRASGSNVFGEVPTKYISSITDTSKLNFLKRSGLDINSTDYVGKVVLHNENSVPPTLLYTNFSYWEYNKKHDMLISYQSEKTILDDGTSHYDYHLVFEDATTREILRIINNVEGPNGGPYLNMFMSENAIYFSCSFTDNSTYNRWMNVAYDLDTFEPITIYDKSLTYSTGYADVRTSSQVVDDRYYMMYHSYRPSSTSTTIYYYAYIYDDISKEVTTLVNSSVTGASTSSTNMAALATLNCGDDGIYILCSWGCPANRVILFRLDSSDTSFTTEQIRTSTSATINANTLSSGYGIDFDSTYLLWCGYYISKTDSSVGSSYKYHVEDTAGNVLVNNVSIPKVRMVDIDGTQYLYLPYTTLYRMCRIVSFSFDVSNVIVSVVVDEIYPISSSVRYMYVNANNAVTNLGAKDFDIRAFKKNDNGTYSLGFNSQAWGDVVFTPCQKSTSQDFDYSVIYGGLDWFIQKNPDYVE